MALGGRGKFSGAARMFSGPLEEVLARIDRQVSDSGSLEAAVSELVSQFDAFCAGLQADQAALEMEIPAVVAECDAMLRRERDLSAQFRAAVSTAEGGGIPGQSAEVDRLMLARERVQELKTLRARAEGEALQLDEALRGRDLAPLVVALRPGYPGHRSRYLEFATANGGMRDLLGLLSALERAGSDLKFLQILYPLSALKFEYAAQMSGPLRCSILAYSVLEAPAEGEEAMLLNQSGEGRGGEMAGAEVGSPGESRSVVPAGRRECSPGGNSPSAVSRVEIIKSCLPVVWEKGLRMSNPCAQKVEGGSDQLSISEEALKRDRETLLGAFKMVLSNSFSCYSIYSAPAAESVEADQLPALSSPPKFDRQASKFSGGRQENFRRLEEILSWLDALGPLPNLSADFGEIDDLLSRFLGALMHYLFGAVCEGPTDPGASLSFDAHDPPSRDELTNVLARLGTFANRCVLQKSADALNSFAARLFLQSPWLSQTSLQEMGIEDFTSCFQKAREFVVSGLAAGQESASSAHSAQGLRAYRALESYAALESAVHLKTFSFYRGTMPSVFSAAAYEKLRPEFPAVLYGAGAERLLTREHSSPQNAPMLFLSLDSQWEDILGTIGLFAAARGWSASRDCEGILNSVRGRQGERDAVDLVHRLSDMERRSASLLEAVAAGALLRPLRALAPQLRKGQAPQSARAATGEAVKYLRSLPPYLEGAPPPSAFPDWMSLVTSKAKVLWGRSGASAEEVAMLGP